MERADVEIKFVSERLLLSDIPLTSIIYGTIKDEQTGSPVKQAELLVMTSCGRLDFRSSSDENGRFTIPVLAVEDLERIYGERELACNFKDYNLQVYAERYEYKFVPHIKRSCPYFIDLREKM